MTLLEFLELLKKKWYLLIIFPVVFGLATAAYCWGFMANKYTATTSIYVLTRSAQSVQNSTTSSSDMSLSLQVANDIAALASSSRVTSAAAKDLGLTSLAGYSSKVTSQESNRVLRLEVTGPDPQTAANIANALAKETGNVGTEIMDLQAVNIVDEAKAPTNPSGPNRMRYTGIAVVVGLLVALGLIVLMDILNTTVRNAKDLEESFDLPILGQLPHVKGLK